MSAKEQTSVTKRMRGVILRYVDNGHKHHSPKADDVMLWGFLLDMGFRGIGQNETISIIHDLCERGYIKCTEDCNDHTGRTRLSEICILPKGRDLLEGTTKDPAVLI